FRQRQRQTLIAADERSERLTLVVMDEVIIQLVETAFALDPVVITGGVFRKRKLFAAHALQQQRPVGPIPQQPFLEAITGTNLLPIGSGHAADIRSEERRVGKECRS